jgi:hypothetical protein
MNCISLLAFSWPKGLIALQFTTACGATLFVVVIIIIIIIIIIISDSLVYDQILIVYINGVWKFLWSLISVILE